MADYLESVATPTPKQSAAARADQAKAYAMGRKDAGDKVTSDDVVRFTCWVHGNALDWYENDRGQRTLHGHTSMWAQWKNLGMPLRYVKRGG